MRVITGKLKGRHFAVPQTFKARPTTDFAKENLFNVLMNHIDFEQTEALDLFAGTGSISLELVSRGCRRVVSIERDPAHFAFIRSVRAKVGEDCWTVVRQDALRIARKGTQTFDLVFADPPYALHGIDTLPRTILDGSLLRPGALLVVEHGGDQDFSALPEFIEHRSYGSVHFSFFKKEG